ncbi:MAG: hypothetical protein ACP5NV_01810 [Candidatus Woesearchaeota archaeon]
MGWFNLGSHNIKNETIQSSFNIISNFLEYIGENDMLKNDGTLHFNTYLEGFKNSLKLLEALKRKNNDQKWVELCVLQEQDLGELIKLIKECILEKKIVESNLMSTKAATIRDRYSKIDEFLNRSKTK